MTFVNEYASKEEKERFDFASIPRMPLEDVKIHPVSPYRWTIDRERDIILIWTWSGREENSCNHYFLYIWKGVLMQLSMKYQFQKSRTVQWPLGHLACPEHLRDEYDDMISNLKEALTVYGVSGRVEAPAGSVEVQFAF